MKCVDNYHISCNFTRETFALTKDGRSLHRFLCDSRKRRTEYESNLLTINFDINIVSFRIFSFLLRFCVTDRKDQRKEGIIMEKSLLCLLPFLLCFLNGKWFIGGDVNRDDNKQWCCSSDGFEWWWKIVYRRHFSMKSARATMEKRSLDVNLDFTILRLNFNFGRRCFMHVILIWSVMKYFLTPFSRFCEVMDVDHIHFSDLYFPALIALVASIISHQSWSMIPKMFPFSETSFDVVFVVDDCLKLPSASRSLRVG